MPVEFGSRGRYPQDMAEDDVDSGDALLAASFGRCVTRHREAADLSISELARRAGVSRAFMWRIESGGSMANLRTMARIALALDVPLQSLVGGVDMSGLTLENRPYASE